LSHIFSSFIIQDIRVDQVSTEAQAISTHGRIYSNTNFADDSALTEEHEGKL